MNQSYVGEEAKRVQKVRLFKSPSGPLIRPVKVGGLIISPKVPAVKQEPQIVQLQSRKFVVQPKPATSKNIVVSSIAPSTYKSSNREYTTAPRAQCNQARSQVQSKTASKCIIPQSTNISNSQYTAQASQPEDPEDIYYNSSELDADNESISSIIGHLDESTTIIEANYYRYHTIIKDLLRLRNNFVRKTIAHAIRQKRYYRSSRELLDVIFKSFGIILESVKIDQLPLNPNYMQATVSFLAKIIETGLFLELIENKEETPDIREFVSSTMSKALDEISAAGIYQSAYEVIAKKKRDSYVQVLDLLAKSTNHQNSDVTSNVELTQARVDFWLYQVLPLVLYPKQDIQSSAIKAVNSVLSSLLRTDYQSNQKWEVLQNEILEQYVTKIREFFDRKNANWYLIWNICIRLLDVQIPRSASTLNLFLSLVEPALRCHDPKRRAEGYLCWRVLLEVLVRHQRLSSEKRLKLVCTPLRSLQARTVEIATNKFNAWWYVMCNVEEHVQNYNGMVFEPFLQFCFGLLKHKPCLSIQNDDESTQVKNFPNVCLIVVAALIRTMGDGDKQIDEIFERNGLEQPSHCILSPTIFTGSTAFIVINACGEATIMLNKIYDDGDDNIDYSHLAISIWSRLFNHVNQAANIQHISSIIQIARQLAKLNSHQEKRSRILPKICETILQLVITSFVVNSARDDTVIIVHDVLSVIAQYQMSESCSDNVIDKILTLSSLANDVTARRLLIATFSVLFVPKWYVDIPDNRINQIATHRFDIWLKINTHIISLLQGIDDKSTDLNESRTHLIISNERFYQYLYWPLSIALVEQNFDVYATELMKTADFAFSIAANRPNFCKQSAATINGIISSHQYCCYINKFVAQLLKYAAYSFNDADDAPVDMLSLCEHLVKKDARNMFQDLNPLVESLIKYRQALNQKQYKIVAKHFDAIVALLKDDKTKLRKSSESIKELESVLNDTIPNENAKTRKSKDSSSHKPMKSSKREFDDDFVVVDKKWSLQPDKLTEHQRERMKSRRCDIPALYNDLSRSQDSHSVSEWKSKARRSLALDATPEASDDNKRTTDGNIDDDTSLKAHGLPKLPTDTVTPTVKVEEQIKTVTETQPVAAGRIGNRRMTRELSRKQSESFNESLPETNRKTRSASQKMAIESPEQRTTRSNSMKIGNENVETKVDLKKKQPSTPISTPKNQAKVKSATPTQQKRTEAEANDSSPFNGSTPKRGRPKRQSARHENESNIDDEIVKALNSKLVPLNNLELRVERLPENVDEINDIISKNKAPLHTESNSSEQLDTNGVPTTEINFIDVPDIFQPSDKTELLAVVELVEPHNSTEAIPTEPIKNEKPLADEAEMGAVVNDEEEKCSESFLHGDNDPSKMSTLFFNDISHNRSVTMNDSKIITSPVLDEQKNIDFLNDTLNISPIISDSASPFSDDNSGNNTASAPVKLDNPALDSKSIEMNRHQENGLSHIVEKDACIDKPTTKRTAEKNVVRHAIEQRTPIATQSSSAHSMPGKSNKSSMQSSTPSYQSPVSSKFKVKMGGRGAQLLQMINRSPKPSSPTPSTSNALNTANAMATMLGNTHSTIQNVPPTVVCESYVPHDDPVLLEPTTGDKKKDRSGFLVFSKAMPSLHVSPAVGILKRKHLDLDDSATGVSPAVKRKRVSFNFPLIETKEYIPDEEVNTYFMGTNHSQEPLVHSEVSNEQTYTSKETPSNESPNSQSPDKRSPTKRKLSVRRASRIQVRRINRPSVRNRLKQPLRHRSSDRSSKMSWQSILKSMVAKNGMEPSELLQYLMTQMTLKEILNNIHISRSSAITMADKLSELMAADELLGAVVFDRMSEKHATGILDHALSENLCSTIIKRLVDRSPDEVVDSLTDILNVDQSFADELATHLPIAVIKRRVREAVARGVTSEIRVVLDEILTATQQFRHDDVLPNSFFDWFKRVIARYKVTPEQYLQLTSIIFHNNTGIAPGPA